MSDDLEGQVVFVSGAGRNLGRAIALTASRAGAAVAVNARTDRDAAEAVVADIVGDGGHATAVIGDVSSEADVARMIHTCVEHLGPITSVVHAAAHRTHATIADLTLEEWRRVNAVTVDGAFLLARATLPAMVAAGFGRFVCIGGAAMHTGLPAGHAHLATAKAALVGLVRSIAQEAGRAGVTANIVSPGVVEIDDRIGGPAPTFDGWDPIAASVLGRMVTMEEIAALCVFLCKPIAQPVNGQVINADGGTFLGSA